MGETRPDDKKSFPATLEQTVGWDIDPVQVPPGPLRYVNFLNPAPAKPGLHSDHIALPTFKHTSIGRYRLISGKKNMLTIGVSLSLPNHKYHG